MATRKPKLLSDAEYDALREVSGWYLKAWRHKRELTLEELAAEAGTSKGAVSDFENGKGQRYNRDNLETFAKALSTTVGYLIDLNPFTVDDDWTRIQEGARALDKEDRHAVAAMVARLERKGAA